MMTDSDIHEQGYLFFLNEAQDLLQVIEQSLLGLRESRTPAKVHDLMRAAHTLKGAAASVRFESIKSMAHSLEDVFKALYNPEVVIDSELESLLFEGYECLRLPLATAIAGAESDEADVLHRANLVFTQLQAKLGHYFNPETTIPNSSELGFDITQSIFETGVNERLDQLSNALISDDLTTIAHLLQTQSEVFVGLAESLNLPGFGAIAQAAIAAMTAHPEQVRTVAQIALTDFRQGQAAVLAGDRTCGGEPSTILQQLAGRLPVGSKEAEIGSTVDQNNRSGMVYSQDNQAIPSGKTVALGLLTLTQSWNRFVDFLNQPIWGNGSDTSQQGYSISQKVESQSHTDDLSSSSPQPDEPVLLDFDELTVDPSGNPYSLSDPTLQSALETFLDNFEWVNANQSHSNGSSNAHGNAHDPASFEFQDSDPFTGSPNPEAEVPLENIWDDQEPVDWTLTLETEVEHEHSPKPVSQPEPILQQPNALKRESRTLSPSPKPAIDESTPRYGETIVRPTTVRVNLEHLESISHAVGELLINQNQQTLQDEHLQQSIQELLDRLRHHQQTLNQLRDWSDQMLSLPPGLKQWTSGDGQANQWTMAYTSSDAWTEDGELRNQFDALELDRHNDWHVLLHAALENMVGLETITERIDVSVRQSSQTLNKQGRLLTHIRDDLMDARMIPIGDILNRFPRMMQQLMDVHGKTVCLQLKSTQVLVDKAIAEKLYDPLLHLLRNAFDHGIESADVRRQLGKPEAAQIEIFAYQQGNRTVIEVKDDGRGLDFEQICRRAFERHLLPSDQVDQFSKAELTNLLFEPGFSTMTQISELSGRGIGLDVVRSQMRALKGTVTVTSEPNQGTTFILQLPLTLMTARVLVCQVDQAVYAFLLDEIETILIPLPEQLETIAGQNLFHWQQGQDEYPVPVYKFSSLIDYTTSLPNGFKTELSQSSSLHRSDPSLPTPAADASPLLLLRWQSGFLGIAVDHIIGEQELVIRPLGTAIAPPLYVYGCSILGDGRLTLVIDAKTVVSQGLARVKSIQSHPDASRSVHNASGTSNIIESHLPLLTADNASQTPAANTLKRILVVDDSATIRQSLALTLQRAGYQVVQAQNGVEAIAQLKQYDEVHLITCDIEMPQLNGFEFLMRYKQELAKPKAPVVVMLSSRNSEKHRQLALQLGASAYLTKPYTEQELLSTISSLVIT